MDSNQKAVFKALAYSDLFHFPLTFDELYRYLPLSMKVSVLEETLKKSKWIVRKGIYYSFKKQHILTRQKNEFIVKEKREKARRIAVFLALIPWVQCICISGSLAAGQYKAKDDIDLFIITKVNTLWLSRLLLLFLLSIMGQRRQKNRIHAPNMVCINMLIDKTGIATLISQQDIYIAREIAQLVPLVNKDQTFEMFLKKNTWIKTYLPNLSLPAAPKNDRKSASQVVGWINIICHKLQRAIMGRTVTTEVVSDHFIAFYPQTFRTEFLARYEAKTRTIPH